MAKNLCPPRIAYVVTSSLALGFLRGQLGSLREAGYDVTIIASGGQELTRFAESEGVRAVAVPMAREISPIKDLISVGRLWRVMRRLQPYITNVGTPKAGLLGGLASLLAGVPCRLYILHGLRLETAKNLKRRMLMLAEQLACLCAHRVICVSESLRQRAANLGLVRADQTMVLGRGSCNGVDVSRFALDEAKLERAGRLRRELRIPDGVPVVGFVGRFTRDKGIAELLEAFDLLHARFPELRLLLVGGLDEADSPAPSVIERIKADSTIVNPGFVADMAPYYAIMDILALPTYREGFPYVVLEAQAAGKPAVVTAATGSVDSVVNGVTGIVVPVGDSTGLAGALAKLLENPSLATAMGEAGQRRALAEFQPERIWSGLLAEYQSLLKASGLPLPVTPRQSAANVQAARAEVASS